ncbi:transcriptional regulator [bacterium]|nr:transcriptional regulator [bacterium]
MTNLTDLLHSDAVFPRARWQSRRQVLVEMSEALARANGLDAKRVLEAVNERERLGSTGVGEGVAIPHARVAGLSRAVGGFAKLHEAVDFEAIDERPCDLVFMILAPDDDGIEHLRALAKVARALRRDSVRSGLRAAQSVDAVMAVLAPDQNSNAA